MKRFFLFLMTFTLSALPLCAQEAPAPKKLNVVTTIGQITDIVREIGGDRVNVQGLMGAGVDPHLYKASESDVNKLSKADVVFYNGLHLEAKMGEILKKMNTFKKTVAVSDNVPKEKLLASETYEDQHDPHIWFDISLWKTAVNTVSDTLIEMRPNGREYFEKKRDIYLKRLTDLEVYVRSRASELPKERRILVTAHDAFRYFGQAYNFKVVGLQGISTESEAGTKDVMKLADFIATNKIKAIFIESSVPERNIKAVQEAVRSRGWDVKIGGELFSDAMGDEGSPEGTYAGMIKHNIETIVGSLREKEPEPQKPAPVTPPVAAKKPASASKPDTKSTVVPETDIPPPVNKDTLNDE